MFHSTVHSLRLIKERERELVAEKFKSLAQDTLLNNADQVNHYKTSQQTEILLRKHDAEDEDVEWTLSVVSKVDEYEANDIFEPAEQIRQSINLQKIEKGLGRDYFSYRLGADGVVRRWDGGDFYAKAKAEREAGIGKVATPKVTSPEFLTHVEDKIKNIVEVAVPNSRLERQMGLNSQAISLNEMNGLEEFVRQPGFDVPEHFRRTV